MIQYNGFTKLKAIQNLESKYSTVSELKFSHMTTQEEAGCQFNVNRWHWANKAGKTLETHIVHMKMGNRAGSQSLFRKAAQKPDSLWTFRNVKDLGLPTCCWRESRAVRSSSVLLYPAIMTLKRSLRKSDTCRETEIIRSQMVLGNRLIVIKWQLEEFSLSHGRHIQRWRLQFQWWWWGREEQQTRRKHREERWMIKVRNDKPRNNILKNWLTLLKVGLCCATVFI